MKRKLNRGITLVALIITIIVLLILAVVAISAVNGEGIIAHAQNSKKEYSQSQTNEQVLIDKYLDKLDEEILNEKYELWDGTSSEPTEKTEKEIHIYKVSELKWLQEQVEAGEAFEGYIVYLENNLDLGAREAAGDTIEAKWKTEANRAKRWTPISKTADTPFKATFEGNNHIIKGVYVEETTKFNGIFGRTEAPIQNLTIKNSYIEGLNCSAGIIGRSGTNGIITNCHNINTTVILLEGTNYTCGGVVGQGGADIINCSNSGKIIAYGAKEYSQCGGIVGRQVERKYIKL